MKACPVLPLKLQPNSLLICQWSQSSKLLVLQLIMAQERDVLPSLTTALLTPYFTGSLKHASSFSNFFPQLPYIDLQTITPFLHYFPLPLLPSTEYKSLYLFIVLSCSYVINFSLLCSNCVIFSQTSLC